MIHPYLFSTSDLIRVQKSNNFEELFSLNLPFVIADNSFDYKDHKKYFKSPFYSLNFANSTVKYPLREILDYFGDSLRNLNNIYDDTIKENWTLRWLQSQENFVNRKECLFMIHDLFIPKRIPNSNYLIMLNPRFKSSKERLFVIKQPEEGVVFLPFDKSDLERSAILSKPNENLFITATITIKPNLAPIEYFHTLILPLQMEFYPQSLTQNERKPLNAVLQFIKDSNCQDYKIIFNNYGSNASKNHFHFQIFRSSQFLKEVGGAFAIEKFAMKQENKLNNLNLSSYKSEIFLCTEYPIPFFKIEVKEFISETVAELLIKIAEKSYNEKITFQLLVANVGKEIYFIPRQHQTTISNIIKQFPENENECTIEQNILKKVGKGAYEICGNGTVDDENIFKTISSEQMTNFLRAFALSPNQLNQLTKRFMEIK